MLTSLNDIRCSCCGRLLFRLKQREDTYIEIRCKCKTDIAVIGLTVVSMPKNESLTLIANNV